MGNNVTCALSSSDLAIQVAAAIGGSDEYTETIIDNGVSGELVQHCQDMKELEEYFEELNVSHIHRRKILLYFIRVSSHAATDDVGSPLTSLQVVEEIRALGKNYEDYGELIVNNDIHSDILAFDEGSAEANARFYHEIGIKSNLHIKAISRHFMSCSKSFADISLNVVNSAEPENVLSDKSATARVEAAPTSAVECDNTNTKNLDGIDTDAGICTDLDTVEQTTASTNQPNNGEDSNENTNEDITENEISTDDMSKKEEEGIQKGNYNLTPTKPIHSKPSHPSPRSSEAQPKEQNKSHSLSSQNIKDPHDVCPEAAILLDSGITMSPAEIFTKLFQLQSIDMDPRYITSFHGSFYLYHYCYYLCILLSSLLLHFLSSRNIEECLSCVMKSTAPPMSRTLSSSSANINKKSRTSWNVTLSSSSKRPSPLPQREYEYDYFINYRVKSELDVVEKSFYFLTSKGYKVYWDKKCLKSGQDWKEGFINGIKKSKYFIPFISEAGVATKPYNCKDSLRDHSRDNVLIEYETAIHISKNTQNASFICPVVVGAYRKFSVKREEDDGVVEEEGLIKYRDFDASQFSASIKFDLNSHKNEMMEWFVNHVPSITEKKTFLDIINWACDKNIYTIKEIWTKLTSKDDDNNKDGDEDNEDDSDDDLDFDCSMEDLQEIKIQMELQFGNTLDREDESGDDREDQEEEDEEGEEGGEQKDNDESN